MLPKVRGKSDPNTSPARRAAMSTTRGAATSFSKSVLESLTKCSSEVGLYGACIKQGLPDVQKGMCEQQFLTLKKCFRTQLKQSLRKSRAK